MFLWECIEHFGAAAAGQPIMLPLRGSAFPLCGI
jgi:hypothetical protein